MVSQKHRGFCLFFLFWVSAEPVGVLTSSVGGTDGSLLFTINDVLPYPFSYYGHECPYYSFELPIMLCRKCSRILPVMLTIMLHYAP